MTTDGIEAVFLETHNWGKAAKFLQALGFELEFSTDHNSGQLRNGDGPSVFIAEIPENLLDHYDRIVRKHNGVALAEVRDEKCGACGMIVRPHVIQEMRRAESAEMFHCETCTRIIYYIEPSVSSASASQASASASTSRES